MIRKVKCEHCSYTFATRKEGPAQCFNCHKTCREGAVIAPRTKRLGRPPKNKKGKK